MNTLNAVVKRLGGRLNNGTLHVAALVDNASPQRCELPAGIHLWLPKDRAAILAIEEGRHFDVAVHIAGDTTSQFLLTEFQLKSWLLRIAVPLLGESIRQLLETAKVNGESLTYVIGSRGVYAEIVQPHGSVELMREALAAVQSTNSEKGFERLSQFLVHTDRLFEPSLLPVSPLYGPTKDVNVAIVLPDFF